MIAHWPLEGNPNDEAYGNYNGTEIGGVSYGRGILGDCYDNTSGSGTGIQLMEHADAQKFDNVFSWSLWFKSTTTSGGSYERVISRDLSEYMAMAIDQTQSGIQNIRGTGGSAQVNEWHHWAYVHESDRSYRSYLDGQQISSGTEAKNGTARPWVIGGNTEGDGDISGRHFVGKIDDCRFYDHVLSVAEIKELARGKLGHWTFFEGKAYDATIQKNHGVINGNPQRVDGKVGSDALDFDGTNDFIQTPISGQIAGDPYTVCAWAYPREVDQNTIVGNYDGTGILARLESGDDYDFWHTSGSIEGGNATLNQWVHLGYVYDGSNGYIYENGNQVASGSLADGSHTNDLRIGDTFDDRKFDGYLDDVRIYKTALSQPEVTEIYQTKARLDEGHRFHGQAIEEGAYESFETGNFSENWNVSNATISSSRQYRGTYSFGSWNDGGIEATWEVFPNDERKIKSFEYFWKEDSSQSGHVVALNDSNGNVIQESGTENPQWYLNNGSGGREFISSSGTNYNVWTKFRFEFDWENGNYDYLLEKTNGSHRETGTQPLESASNGVQYIRFSGGSTLNGYGSGNYNRFDGIKVNEEGVREEGFIDSSKFSEVGPAADSLIGWWKLNGNLKDFAGKNDGANNGANVVDGYGQTAYDFEENNTDYINLGVVDDRFALGRGDFTFSAWVNFESVQNSATIFELSRYTDALLVRPTNDNGGEIEIYMDNQNNTSRTFQPGIDDTTGVWTQFVVTRRSGTVEVFQDASSLGTQAMDGVFEINQDSYIGTSVHNVSDQNHDGKMQDVRFYDAGMTPEQVQVLYEMSKPDAKMKKRPEGFYAPQFSETQL